MDKHIYGQVKKILADASVASVRSWLRGKGKKIAQGKRERMLEHVAELIEKEAITFADLEEGVIGIEEAAGKLIFLFNYKEDRTAAQVIAGLTAMGIPVTKERSLAKSEPAKSTAAYATVTGDIVRVKWSETHKKLKLDLDEDKIAYEKVSKVIVLTANLKSKQVELRYDRPENIQPHGGMGFKQTYFDYYVTLAAKILGAQLQKSDLQKSLKQLVENSPSLVRLHRGGHTNQRNNFFSGTAKKGADIRDDEEYKAMHAKGGAAWAYEDQSFYWRPDQSNGALSREFYSHVDTIDSFVRVDADCWDAEVDYAIQKIRSLQ
jgi:hypothetical protein